MTSAVKVAKGAIVDSLGVGMAGAQSDLGYIVTAGAPDRCHSVRKGS